MYHFYDPYTNPLLGFIWAVADFPSTLTLFCTPQTRESLLVWEVIVATLMWFIAYLLCFKSLQGLGLRNSFSVPKPQEHSRGRSGRLGHWADRPDSAFQSFSQPSVVRSQQRGTEEDGYGDYGPLCFRNSRTKCYPCDWEQTVATERERERENQAPTGLLDGNKGH